MVNEDVLGSWNDGRSKEAILDSFARSPSREDRTSSRRRIASRRSTTTEPSGARSRCRSSSISSCDACTRWRRHSPSSANASRGRRRTSATTRGWVMSSTSTTRGTSRGCRCSRAGVLAAYDGMSVEDFEARSNEFLRETQHPTLGRGYLRVCVYADGRTPRVPARERVHQLHRLRRWPRLHAADQRGGVRHPAGSA